MPLNLVIGNKGTGKTTFLAYQARKAYYERGEMLKRRSCESVNDINVKHGLNLTPPKDVPIFTSPNFKLKFIVGWYKYFEPYLVNPYYIGTCDNSGKPIMFLPPGSVFFIPELQRVLDSRRSVTFPGRLSQWFEESRHWDIEFWGDGQRGNLMDKNFREITDKIYEMQGVKIEEDKIGRPAKVIMRCREFPSLKAFDAYANKGTVTYKETTYIDNGSIFDCFDSKQCRSDYIPPQGKDFSYLKHLTKDEILKLPSEEAAIYLMSEPKWFRGGNDDKPD